MSNLVCANAVGHDPHAWGGPDGGGLEWCPGVYDDAPEMTPEAFAALQAVWDAHDREHVANADPVNSPPHYTWLGGIEVIDITEHLSFTLGNVVKYVLRADHKGKPIEDLRKARYYLDRELKRRGYADD